MSSRRSSISWRQWGLGEEYQLGYLPRTSNTEIAQLLEMGWATVFECRISKINEDAHYENQIRLTIRIRQNQQAQNCV